MAQQSATTGFSAEALSDQLQQCGVDLMLSPAQVAAILNVSPKWLANAREGRKQLSGPPYIKLGDGKTAPIRYPLTGVRDWLASFPKQTHTCHRFSEFLETERGRWLYLVNDSSLEFREFFEAMHAELKPDRRWRPRWLAAADVKAGRFFKPARLFTAFEISSL